MERDKIKFEELFQKYLSNSLTKAEYKELLSYFNEDIQHGYVLPTMESCISNTEIISDKSEHTEMLNRVEKNLKSRIQETSKVKTIYPRYFRYAAAILISILGIGYFYFKQNNQSVISQMHVVEILPGNNRAQLILSDGSSYNLSEKDSSVVMENNSIHYINGERVVGDIIGNTVSLVTPKGGQYRVVLSDGTNVMLNSSSSISYPSQFPSSERRVLLKGEGYFEVSKDTNRPFIVESIDQEITVLGTKFNIHAYENGPMQTTLLEGSIKQRSKVNQQTVTLNPGQQIESNEGSLKVSQVNPNDYVAWVDGYFIFNNMPLDQLFKHLERWYDIEIEYSNNISDSRFYVEIPRTYHLTKVLNALEKTSGLHFKQEGRRIYVTR